MAASIWRRHGCWCDSSDYEAEAVAELGAAVKKYVAAPGGGFLPFAKQRVHFTLVDYYRKAFGRREVEIHRTRGAPQGYARHEWSWDTIPGLTVSLERQPTGERIPRGRWKVLQRAAVTNPGDQRDALIDLAGVMQAARHPRYGLRPSEWQALQGICLTGFTGREYSLLRGMHPASGWAIASQGLAKLRRVIEEDV